MPGQIDFASSWYLIFIWNYFLAVIPWALSYVLYRYFDNIHFALLYPLLLVWLLFSPNIPYLFTGIRHISDVCIPDKGAFACFDNMFMVLLLFLYSFFGIFLFYSSLKWIKNILGRITYLKKVNILFIPLIIPVISLGILLGLVDRLNSWEAVLSPLMVIEKALSYFYGEKALFLLAFTCCLYIVYYTVQLFIFLASRDRF